MQAAYYPMKFDVPHRGLKWLEYYAGHNVYHPGWDFNRGVGNQDLGDELVSPFNGIVEVVSPAPSAKNKQNGGFGWFVVIKSKIDGQNYYVRLAHMNKVEVSAGQQVLAGERVGECGKTGTVYAHCHFEVFGEKMAEIQRDKAWRFYPSGKSKSWVSDHYYDGLGMVDHLNSVETPDEFADAREWAIDNGISNGDRPKDPVTREECWLMMQRLASR